MTPSEKKAELYYNQGTRELVAKDYTLALQKLLRANQLRPDDTRILNNLGMAFFFKKDQRNALKFIKKAIKLDESNMDAKLNLATIYMKSSQLNKAKEIYQDLLGELTYLGHHRTHYNMALISLAQNKNQEAIEHLNKSIEINPNYCPAFFKLGELAQKRKNYSKALGFYKDSTMGTCYNNITPHMAQVDMMVKLQNYDDARIKLDEMLEKFALTREEILVKNKIEEVNNTRRTFEHNDQEYSKNLNRNILSSDF